MSNDGMDEGQHADAAKLLRGLPKEAPTTSLASAVVEQVRPVALRRRRMMVAVFVVAALAAVAYVVSAMQVAGGG